MPRSHSHFSTGSGLADAPSDGTTYGRKDAAWVDVMGAFTDVTQVVYVAKTGSDSDSGLNIEAPMLTINSALTYIATQTPSDTSRWAVQVIDAGLYDETNIVLSSFVFLDMKYATLSETTLRPESDSGFYINRSIYNGGGNTYVMQLSTDDNVVGYVGDFSATGNGRALQFTGGDCTNCHIEFGNVSISSGKLFRVNTTVYRCSFTVGTFIATGASGSMLEFRHGNDDDLLVKIASAELISGTAQLLDLANSQRSTVECGVVKGFTELLTIGTGAIALSASYIIDTPINIYTGQTICVAICTADNSAVTIAGTGLLNGRIGNIFYNQEDTTIYVAKSGSDANVGNNPLNPLLTIGAACTLVDAETRSDAARWTIKVIDSGDYSPGGTITIPTYTRLDMEQSTLRDTILTPSTGCSFEINNFVYDLSGNIFSIIFTGDSDIVGHIRYWSATDNAKCMVYNAGTPSNTKVTFDNISLINGRIIRMKTPMGTGNLVEVGTVEVTTGVEAIVDFRNQSNPGDVSVHIGSAVCTGGGTALVEYLTGPRNTLKVSYVKGFLELFTNGVGAGRFEAEMVEDTPINIYADQDIDIDIAHTVNSAVTIASGADVSGRIDRQYFDSYVYPIKTISADTDLASWPSYTAFYIDGAYDADLPAGASSLDGKEIRIKNISTSNATVTAAGSDTIEDPGIGITGVATITLMPGDAVVLKWNNANTQWENM